MLRGIKERKENTYFVVAGPMSGRVLKFKPSGCFSSFLRGASTNLMNIDAITYTYDIETSFSPPLGAQKPIP